MANQYYSDVIAGLSPLFAEQGFKESEDVAGVYLSDRKAVKVEYSEERKMFLLHIADIADGEGVEFREVSGWLFDSSHSAKDAAIIAEDFTRVIQDELGIVRAKTVINQKVAMPTKNAAGTAPGVEALAKRFLDMFPEYKGYYKESMGKYNEFLYEDFFRNTAALKLRELVDDPNSNKRHLTKLFTVLNEMFAEGDSNLSNVIMFTIVGGAFGGDVAKFDSMAEYYAECPYIKQYGRTMVTVIAGNKKYQAALK